MIELLKNKIVQMVTSITKIAEVYNFESSVFRGDPTATITCSGNTGDYRTTSENIRTYAYTIRLWVEQNKRTDQQAEAVLADLQDDVLNMFDKYYTLGAGSPGTPLLPPTGYTMIRVQATPAAWFWVDRGGAYRMAEVTVRCEIDVDVTLI